MVKISPNNNQGSQLTIPNLVSEPQSSSITESVIEQKLRAIEKYLKRANPDTIACVGTYKVKGNSYFRLSYRQGTKVKHIHIKGGNTMAKLANYRAKELQALIDRGAALSEVIAMAQDFNS